MKLLLDTSVFLWHLAGDERQPLRFRAAISAPSNEVFVSVVSLWEIFVKHGDSKLPLPHAPQVYLPQVIRQDGFTCLPLEESSVLLLPKLAMIHRDPFDRMLLCQALAHDLTFLSVDRHILAYPGVNFLQSPFLLPCLPSPNRLPKKSPGGARLLSSATLTRARPR